MKKLFHNGMVLLMLVCLLISTLPCANIQAASKNKKAGSAFARAVASGKIPYKKIDSHRTSVFLQDLNGDGIKELIMFYDDGPSFDVWQYAKGKASLLVSYNFDPGLLYYIKSKKQFWYMGECDGSWLRCYQVVGKKVKERVRYDYSILFKGKYPVEKKENGKVTKISFKKYKKLLKNIQKNNSAKPISKTKLIQKLASMK